MEELLERLFTLSRKDRDGAIKKFSKILDVYTKNDDIPPGCFEKSMTEVKVAKKRTPSKSKQIKYENVINLTTSEDKEIFTKLKNWRSEVSRDLEIQPYLVFNNQTLIDMAFYKPEIEKDLLKIKGVAEEKLGKYGETIIEIIKSVTGKESVEVPQKRRLKSN